MKTALASGRTLVPAWVRRRSAVAVADIAGFQLMAVHERHDGDHRGCVIGLHARHISDAADQVLIVRGRAVRVPPRTMEGPATEWRGGRRGGQQALPGGARDGIEMKRRYAPTDRRRPARYTEGRGSSCARRHGPLQCKPTAPATRSRAAAVPAAPIRRKGGGRQAGRWWRARRRGERWGCAPGPR